MLSPLKLTQEGNIWFGTDGQLIKWDGNYNWEFFTTENSPLPANGIRSLKADKKGGIWIGTINGVCYFDGSNFITLDSLNSFLRGLPGDGKRIIDIEIDPKGNVWLGTWGGGVVKYDGKNITAYNKDGMMRFITGIEIDSRGNIFVSSFSEFDENTNQYTGGGTFHIRLLRDKLVSDNTTNIKEYMDYNLLTEMTSSGQAFLTGITKTILALDILTGIDGSFTTLQIHPCIQTPYQKFLLMKTIKSFSVIILPAR
jgi:hypothetical protein